MEPENPEIFNFLKNVFNHTSYTNIAFHVNQFHRIWSISLAQHVDIHFSHSEITPQVTSVFNITSYLKWFV